MDPTLTSLSLALMGTATALSFAALGGTVFQARKRIKQIITERDIARRRCDRFAGERDAARKTAADHKASIEALEAERLERIEQHALLETELAETKRALAMEQEQADTWARKAHEAGA